MKITNLDALAAIHASGNYPALAGDPISGRIYSLANDSAFAGATPDTAMTEFVAGMSDPENLLETLGRIVPNVPSPLRFNYLKYNEIGQYTDMSGGDTNSTLQTNRPRGGEFANMKFDGVNTHDRLYNRGLQITIDDDEGGNDPAVQQRYTQWLWNIVYRAEIIFALNLINANAASQGTITWQTGTTATPDTDMATLVNKSGDLRGLDANKVILGSGDWLYRMGACQRNISPGVSNAALLTPEQVASVLGIDDIVRVKTRKQTAPAAKAKLLTGTVYAYMTSQVAVKEDPSNIKRFVGMEGDQVYVEKLIKRTRIAVSIYSNTAITNSLGIAAYTIA